MEKLILTINQLISLNTAILNKVGENSKQIEAVDAKLQNLTKVMGLFGTSVKGLDTKLAKMEEFNEKTRDAMFERIKEIIDQVSKISVAPIKSDEAMLDDALANVELAPIPTVPDPIPSVKEKSKNDAEAIIDDALASVEIAPIPSAEPKSNDDAEDITVEELKSMFDSMQTNQRRTIAQAYLRNHGKQADARIKEKLTWEYCSTIGDDNEFANYVLDFVNEQ